MTRVSRRRVLVVVAAAFAASCADRVDAPSSVAPTPDPAGIATLVVTGAPTRPGVIVTLAAHLTQGTAVKRTGAYLAHIEYDTTLITYVGQGDATGGIAAFHAQAGVLRVAGASLDGYTGGVLFNAQFRVARTGAQPELRLVIDELRDMDLNDRLPPAVAARSSVVRPWRP
jgi:hypothetical protein